MKILLDTNFIITCLKRRIEIPDDIENSLGEKIEMILLSSVLKEIEKISKNKNKKIKERKMAELFLKMINEKILTYKEIKTKIENVDYSIINTAKKNEDIIVATFDKNIRKKIKNRILTIKGKKMEII